MNILITGGTGLVGKELGPLLAKKGHRLFVISRSSESAKKNLKYPCEVLIGDLNKAPLKDDRLKNIDAVINLLGEPISGERWSEKKKESIYHSRVFGTRHLIESLPHQVKIFISGSAIGYYGDCAAEKLSEDHPPGHDFLAKVCHQWEFEAQKARTDRLVILRTGLILSTEGGALKTMLPIFKTGLGGMLGDGQHIMSWVHHTDIVKLIIHLLETPDIRGVYNATADKPVTNQEFSESLASTLKKTTGPRVPKLALKVLYGDATEAILSSQNCVNTKIKKNGFEFKFKTISEAFKDIVNN